MTMTATMMMHCPTCDETIPQGHCQDGICLTCGDRLIPRPDSAAQSRQQQQQQQQVGGGAGGGGGDAAFAGAAAGGVGNGDGDAAITVDDAISAFSLLPSFPGMDEFMGLLAGAGGSMTMPTANNTTTNHRPASQKALDNLKREVLTAKSAELLETQVEFFEPCSLNEISSSSIMSSSVTSHAPTNRRLTLDAIPAEFTHHIVHDNHHPTTATSSANKSSIMTPQHHHHHQRTTAALVLCTPRTTKGGQLSSQTLSEISLLRKHGIPFIAYVTRGDNVTFVQKALVCQRAGIVSQSNSNSISKTSTSSISTSTSRCIGVIVGNAGSGDEVWPYIMQDLKKEAQQYGLTVPVVMIRRDDGRRLVQWATTFPKSKSDGEHDEMQRQQLREGEELQQCNNTNSYYTPCRIIIRNKDSESNSCPVCADSFAIGDTIVRLPSCGHVFHEACAMMWLTKHNTCPYCRSELPTEDEEYERERRQRRENVPNEDDGGVNGNGHANFYG